MTDSVNSRELVLAILLAVTKDGIYSHVAISDVLTKYQYLEKQERSFITRVSVWIAGCISYVTDYARGSGDDYNLK